MKKLCVILPLALILCFMTSYAREQADSAQSIKTGYITIEKGRLYYEEMGEGKTLIMIHGGMIDRRMWDEQFMVFAKHFRVIRYDARNHGLTESESGTYKYYEDLRVLCDDLDMPDIIDIVNRVDTNVENSQKVIIPGAAHMVNMEKPKTFNKLVLGFLNELK